METATRPKRTYGERNQNNSDFQTDNYVSFILYIHNVCIFECETFITPENINVRQAIELLLGNNNTYFTSISLGRAVKICREIRPESDFPAAKTKPT